MKKILCGLLILVASVSAHAQFQQGQTLTASALNAALAAPTITGGSINGAPIGQTTPAAGSFTTISGTGSATFNTSGASVVLTDPNNSSGANLRFVGNGATTPAKTIRAQGGALQFINDAYSSVIASLSDGGGFSANVLNANSLGITNNTVIGWPGIASNYSVITNSAVTGANGTLFTTADALPIATNAGFNGYSGVVIPAQRWGNSPATVDSHNILYIAGSQRNVGADTASIIFGNWGYFTSSGSAAGGLGDATARGDAVTQKFTLVAGPSQFVGNNLVWMTRTASGTSSVQGTFNQNGNLSLGGGDTGDKLAIYGSATVKTIGAGLKVAEGANAKQLLSAAMAAGSVTIANTSVTANSRVICTRQPGGTNPGAAMVTAITAGTSFVVTSTNAADTGPVACEIFEPG